MTPNPEPYLEFRTATLAGYSLGRLLQLCCRPVSEPRGSVQGIGDGMLFRRHTSSMYPVMQNGYGSSHFGSSFGSNAPNSCA